MRIEFREREHERREGESEEMANPRGSSRRHHLSLVVLLSLISVRSEVSCYRYKVGDLDAWGVPASASEQVYDKWSKYHNFSIGDSLCKYPRSLPSAVYSGSIRDQAK